MKTNNTSPITSQPLTPNNPPICKYCNLRPCTWRTDQQRYRKKCNICTRGHYWERPQAMKDRMNAWCRSESAKASRRARYAINQPKHRIYSNAFQKRRRLTLKDQAYEKLGNKCSSPTCKWVNEDGSKGCTNRQCLQIDHVHGGAYAQYKSKYKNHRPDGTYIYRQVLLDQEGTYQILCSNCNWIKRSTNKETHPCV